MTVITPEQFMTLTEPDEEDFEPFEREVLAEWSEVPRQNGKNMSWVMESLQRIEARLDEPVADGLREAYDDLEAKHAELYALLEEVEGILKPSASKLANTVREAITRWRAPEVPEPETVPVENAVEMGAPPPEPHADVEEWREYARDLGYAGPALDTANRSQIRTILGIPQPGTPVPPTVVHA